MFASIRLKSRSCAGTKFRKHALQAFKKNVVNWYKGYYIVFTVCNTLSVGDYKQANAKLQCYCAKKTIKHETLRIGLEFHHVDTMKL